MQDRDQVSDQASKLAGEVMDSLGVQDETPAEASNESMSAETGSEKDLPEIAKQRLGRQEKRHQRDVRDLRNQIAALQNQVQSGTHNNMSNSVNPYSTQQGIPGSVEEQMQKAVNFAFQARDEQDRREKQAQQVAQLQQHYQGLQNDLENASSKYDDFQEKVIDNPSFTDAMRDIALVMPNRVDVLYKLGKNPEDLKRIAALHPVDQGRELWNLSHALMGGQPAKVASAPQLPGSIRNNPVSSSSITENTSPADIRARMKAGKWK